MENKVIEVINTLCEKVGMTINWGSENVMPYIQEMIAKCSKYFLISDLVWTIVPLIFVITCIVILISCYKWCKKNDDYEDFGCFILCVFSIGIGIIFAIILFLNFENLIQDLTFPEIRIINYINDMNWR